MIYACLLIGITAMLLLGMAFKPKPPKDLPPVKASHLQPWGGHFKQPVRMASKDR